MSGYDTDTVPTSFDYSDLRDHPKRIWGQVKWERIGLHVPIAWNIPGLAAGAVGFAFAFALTFLLGVLIDLGMAAYLLPILGFAGGYAGWVRPTSMNPADYFATLWDFQFSQPRRFDGLTSDTEPTHLHWTVVTYMPRGIS